MSNPAVIKPPVVPAPCALVLTEKHGTRIFTVTNDAELYRTAFYVLVRRLREGWYPDPGFSTLAPTEEDHTRILALPVGRIRDVAMAEYLRQLKRAQDDVAEMRGYQRILDVVYARDGMGAWDILCSRTKYEYESCSLQPIERVPAPVDGEAP